MRILTYMFLAIFSIGMLGVLTGAGMVVYVISYYGQDLPTYSQLKKYQSSALLPSYGGDSRLIAEHAKEERAFVAINKIPSQVKHAFIAAEDPNFYTHGSVDFVDIYLTMIMDVPLDKRPKGASTITYQVARNFLLTHKFSHEEYKIRVVLLSFRMEKALSKEHLLELYLNNIYLGEDCYGIAAATLNYFDKPLENLTIEEIAYLAALPKAPNNYSPERRPEAARERRDCVIRRMQADGYITAEQGEAAIAKPLIIVRAENRQISTR